ncbi:hypothetical protein [Nonomuraea sp. 10N515B]|uniref:hypothetical protein n=1 Tax=Nonomuraea sp. 10N515B TaxID=3457422 RepID=UPI003FCD1D41
MSRPFMRLESVVQSITRIAAVSCQGMNNVQWTPLIGMAVGIVLGVVGAFGGLGAFLLVLGLGSIGFVAGRVAATGEVNVLGLSLRRK